MSEYPEGKIPLVEHKGTKASLEFIGGMPFFSVEFAEWTHSLYKEYVAALSEVLEYLRGLGFYTVYAHAHNVQEEQVAALFGFAVEREMEEVKLLSLSV